MPRQLDYASDSQPIDFKPNTREVQPLPKLARAAFSGDIVEVRRRLRAGDDASMTFDMLNNFDQCVVGVTPLYLAAQRGHITVVKELLNAGADPKQACLVTATGEAFKPSDIALIHLHIRTWWAINHWSKSRTSTLKGQLKSIVKIPSKQQRHDQMGQPLFGCDGITNGSSSIALQASGSLHSSGVLI